MSSKSILRLQQGDQFAIPFPVFIGDTLATPDNVTGVRIQIEEDLCEYPGTLTFDAEAGCWQYPLTESQTRTWALDKHPAQVGVRIGDDDFRYCPTFYVWLEKNIITEEWSS